MSKETDLAETMCETKTSDEDFEGIQELPNSPSFELNLVKNIDSEKIVLENINSELFENSDENTTNSLANSTSNQDEEEKFNTDLIRKDSLDADQLSINSNSTTEPRNSSPIDSVFSNNSSTKDNSNSKKKGKNKKNKKEPIKKEKK